MDPLFHYWFTLKSTLPWGTALLLFQKLRQNICAAESFKIQGDERGENVLFWINALHLWQGKKGHRPAWERGRKTPKTKSCRSEMLVRCHVHACYWQNIYFWSWEVAPMRPGENHCEAKAPSILCLQHTMSNRDVSANQSHVITECTDHRDRQHTDVLIGSKCQCAASA